jgi:hypothetical protein
MFRTFLVTAAIATTALLSAPAQSQVRVETTIDRPGYDGPRYRERRGYEVRRVERRRFSDCRTVEKRRVNRFGEVVVRRTRICG